MGNLAWIEEEKNAAVVKLEDKKRELDGLRITAGKKLELLKEEKDQCKDGMVGMREESDQMMKEEAVLYGEVSKLRKVEVEVCRLQSEQELRRSRLRREGRRRYMGW